MNLFLKTKVNINTFIGVLWLPAIVINYKQRFAGNKGL